MASLEDHARHLTGDDRPPSRDAVKMVLRVADDNMRPLRVLVARMLVARGCDCGFPKEPGEEDRCYCKEANIR